MNALNIPQHLIQSIGWTLIHSLWQGLAIYFILKVIYRFTDRADLRYGVSMIGLTLVIVCSTITFLALNEKTTSPGFQFVIDLQAGSSTGSQSFIQLVLQWVDSNIIWLIRFWMLGFVVGLLRIAAGLWYIGRLRRDAHPVQDEWMDLVKKLSGSLSINRMVTMAEAGISSPMVVGFMKPMVLFPVGLLSGLTMEQVETILVHELSHVRRQDYIINLVQSVIETIFFFNPFVLLISSLIREERENCCDDMVIAKGISPISYVRTLAQLEASRSSSSLALGIAGNQNQLLNRIKRIMENSAKNDWGRGRLVPVALLFLGLICASWLSIGSEAETNNISHNVTASDTAKPGKSTEDGLTVIRRGRSNWVLQPPAELSEPVPEIEFVPGVDFDVDFAAPPFPADLDLDVVIADMPAPFEFEMPEIALAPFEFDSFEGFTNFDSIPGMYFRTGAGEWDEFEKEFTKKFKAEFKEFYEKNHDKIDKMMEDAKRDEVRRREAAETVDLAELQRWSERDFARKKMTLDLMTSQDMAEFSRQAQMANEQVRALGSMQADQLAKHMQGQDMQLNSMSKVMRDQAIVFEQMARASDKYNGELIQMLKEDGYVTKDESGDSLTIMDENGQLTINGHKIKEKDRVKYEALRDRYFNRAKRERTGRSE